MGRSGAYGRIAQTLVVTASLLISRLQSYPRQGQLTRLLQEYGRLIKTIFVLRYLEDEALRHHIRAQLNKGEKLHDLRKLLFFAREGVVSQQYEEGQTNCYQGSSKGFTRSLIQGEVWAGYILHHTSY